MYALRCMLPAPGPPRSRLGGAPDRARATAALPPRLAPSARCRQHRTGGSRRCLRGTSGNRGRAGSLHHLRAAPAGLPRAPGRVLCLLLSSSTRWTGLKMPKAGRRGGKDGSLVFLIDLSSRFANAYKLSPRSIVRSAAERFDYLGEIRSQAGYASLREPAASGGTQHAHHPRQQLYGQRSY